MARARPEAAWRMGAPSSSRLRRTISAAADGVAALRSAGPVIAPRARAIAIVGACFFCLQTVVLDGLVWPLSFSI